MPETHADALPTSPLMPDRAPQPRRARWPRRIALAIAAPAFVAVGGVLGAHTLWGFSRLDTLPSAPRAIEADFLPWSDHDRIYQAGAFPYTLEIESGAGTAIYIGARHTSDPDDPQVGVIVDRWNTFDPTVALMESRMGLYIGGLRAGVGMFGEAGAVYALARDNGVPAYSIEPAYEDEVEALLEDFAPEQVALFFTMRVFWSEIGARPGADPDALVLHLARKRTNLDPLRGVITSPNDIDAIWRRDFPGLPDWRTPSASDAIPTDTWLGRIADADREVRGRHMVRLIADLVERGERVFAVVGASHVIRQEPMLREVFGDDAVTLHRAPPQTD